MNRLWLILSAFAAIAWASCSALAVPDLTEGQRIQLETATDGDGAFDTGALYPLLFNAQDWEPGDESGATVPKYIEIMERPAEHRGELLLIEGLFNGSEDSRRKITGLTREGPWEDQLELWFLVVEEISNRPILVYMVNPPEAVNRGDRVRLAARFYKVWSEAAADGSGVADYLVFVGHSATVTPQNAAFRQAPVSIPRMLAVFVVVLIAAFYILRFKLLRRNPADDLRAKLDARHHRDEQRDDDAQDDAPPLPEDATEALDELKRRHDSGAPLEVHDR